jgi:hypothetical protein
MSVNRSKIQFPATEMHNCSTIKTILSDSICPKLYGFSPDSELNLITSPDQIYSADELTMHGHTSPPSEPEVQVDLALFSLERSFVLRVLRSQPEAPRPRRRTGRLLAGGDRRPPGGRGGGGAAALEEPRRRSGRARRLLDRRRGRADPERVHERGVRVQRQAHDHAVRVVGALGGAALPLVRVLVPAQRLRAEELAQAEVAREHLVRGGGQLGGGLGPGPAPGPGPGLGGAARSRVRRGRLARAKREVQPRRAGVVLPLPVLGKLLLLLRALLGHRRRLVSLLHSPRSTPLGLWKTMVHQKQFAICFIKEDEVGGALDFYFLFFAFFGG